MLLPVKFILNSEFVVLGLEVFESEEDVGAKALQADHLQTPTQVLSVRLAHGKTKSIAVHWTGGGPVDGVHHVAEDPIDLHQLVCALFCRRKVILSHFVHQVMGNAAALYPPWEALISPTLAGPRGGRWLLPAEVMRPCH